MPNQNNPTQNPNPVNQTSPPLVPPSIFPQSDLPPLPPEFQGLPKNDATTSPPASVNGNAGSSAPPSFSPVISKPKKKFGGGKIIATILGLVILVGGVGAGIMLTQQKQLINQKAQTPPYQCSNAGSVESCYGKSAGDPCTGGVGTCKQNTSGLGCYCDTGGGGGGGGTCDSQVGCDSNGCHTGSKFNTLTCYVSHFRCDKLADAQGCSQYPVAIQVESASFNQTCGSEQIDLVCPLCDINLERNTGHTNICTSSPTPTPTPTNNPTSPPTASPSPSPTPSPSPSPSPTVPPVAPVCVAVKAYDNDWALLTNTQLSALTAGDVVRFCVNGSATSGTFDQAQFMIKSVLSLVTTHDRPGSDDFCQTYTITPTDTTITVKAKIHHSSGVWVGEDF